MIAEGAEAAFGAIGAGAAVGDQRNQFDALRDDINARGGIAGRELQLEYHGVDTARALSNPDQTEAEICAHFTQDIEYVPVVVTSGSVGLGRCLAKADIAIEHPYMPFTSWDYETIRGHWFSPSNLFGDRFAQVYVDQLVELGFLTSDSVIGLLNFDDPSHARISEQVLQPALAAHGMHLAKEVRGSVDGYLSESNSYVLQMKTAGVTHVLNLAAGANVFFMRAAENQAYRPAYGLSSNSGPQAWVALLAPPEQLTGAVGIGWVPINDVPLYSEDPVSPNETRCIEIMRNAGEDMDTQTVALIAYRACDALFFLESAWAQSTTFDPASLQSGMEVLGDSYPGVMGIANSFSAAQPDGISAYRPLAYFTDCSCFRYTGPARPL